MARKSLFTWLEDRELIQERIFDKNIIEDRWSKYSVLAGKVYLSKDNLKWWLRQHLSDKFFRKATHNTYGYRLYDEDGYIIEWSNDDGETWAGKIILDYMQRANLVNAVIVVTRYYGGVMLHADRFRHVVDATQYVLDKHTQAL